jgi:hypothetical protein
MTHWKNLFDIVWRVSAQKIVRPLEHKNEISRKVEKISLIRALMTLHHHQFMLLRTNLNLNLNDKDNLPIANHTKVYRISHFESL